jgi:hypothetical protein
VRELHTVSCIVSPSPTFSGFVFSLWRPASGCLARGAAINPKLPCYFFHKQATLHFLHVPTSSTYHAMSVVFTNNFEALPASGPSGRPHIIDVEQFCDTFDDDEYDDEYYVEKVHIKIWDAVATVLFKISIEALGFFLNFATSSFKLTMHPNSNHMGKLIIWRRGNGLMVRLPPYIFIIF